MKKTYIINKKKKMVLTNSNEFIVKDGFFSGNTWIINDVNEGRKLPRLVKFLMGNDEFTEEEISAYLEEEQDKISGIIDALLENQIISTVTKKTLTKHILFITDFGSNELDFLLKDCKNILGETNYRIVDISEFNENECNIFDFYVVITGTYHAKFFHELNYFCIKNDKQHLISFIDNSKGLVLPVFMKNYSACFNETELHMEACSNDISQTLIFKDTFKKVECLVESQIEKHEQLLLVAFVLNKIKNFNKQGFEKNILMYIDFETMTVEKTKVLQLPYCSACNEDAAYTHIFL